MGMFDSVIAACPKCKEPLEFQSKAGECRLRRYSVNSVPVEIAGSLDGDLHKCECGFIAERNGERSESDCRAKLGDLESKHG